MPEHLSSGVSLPNFSILYNKHRNSTARWMLSAFFLAPLFKEISEEMLSSEWLIVNMLEELLWNCSARELMSNPKDGNIQIPSGRTFHKYVYRHFIGGTSFK